MTRAELIRIVDIVQAAWPTMSEQNRPASIRTWWRYLQDLDFNETLAEIDRRVVKGGWPPRVGEVRRSVLLKSRSETSQEAWTSVLERLRSVETGTEWNEISAHASEAMRIAGMDGRSRPDEKAFKAAFEQIIETEEENVLMLNDPEPFGEIK